MPYALPLYAVTLFVSAFILFLVQPIVGKIILPKLGGTPQVWNTCMVFFQMMLLAGYAYTHNASTRLTLRQQLIAHLVLLCLPFIVLLPFPFAYGGSGEIVGGVVSNPNSLWGFLPDLGSNPLPSTLKILVMYVALPFVVVATTAPLLQKWFVHTGHPAAKDPYFLYGASNLGSMLSLILYPSLIEPMLGLHNQGWLYAYGYIALTLFVLACALMVWNSKDPALKLKHEPAPAAPTPAPAPATPAEQQTAVTATAPAPAPSPAVKPGQPKHQPKGTQPAAPKAPAAHVPSDEMTAGRRLRWVLLAAIPSSLMLGITTHITTDLSPMPLFWLIPLILYLLSFILVFARWPVVWTEQPHVYFLYAQPVFLWLMIMTDVWNLTSQPAFIAFAIVAHVLGFFTTTMVCHGELAKDRPSTKYLTEFYLWMSVGGMCGGMFNGLIAPVIFTRVWEFPLAIFAAAIIRPKMFDIGLFDNWLAGLFEGKADAAPAHKPGHKGAKPAPAAAATVTANESLVQTLDYAWPALVLVLVGLFALVFSQGAMSLSQVFVKSEEGMAILAAIFMFGIPLTLACLGLFRPLRIGLAVGAVLLVHQVYSQREGGNTTTVHTSRSYFGAISVKETKVQLEANGKQQIFAYNQLIHGHINHGMNFLVPEKKTDRQHPELDLSRLATTYYHREGPVGRVMEKFNWFPGKQNTFHADARIGASLVSALASSDPLTGIATAWSEPPIATVGLGTGTMASYGRPYQHVHFYEIDNQILRLSLVVPTEKIKTWPDYVKERDTMGRKTYFNYLEQAIERGCAVQVYMGDARLRMALPYRDHYKEVPAGELVGGGPDNFYHMMVVDAFSSDAIPAHLLTKQAFGVYFNKLTKRGVLCVHTSNRFVDLPKVVAAVAANMTFDEADLGLEMEDVKKEDFESLRDSRKIQADQGVAAVKTVQAGKAADAAGIKVGDIILKINNIGADARKPARDLEEIVVDLEPGAKVPVEILRGDKREPLTITATLGKRTLSYKHLRGHDVNDDRKTENRGHFTSEWVMVARRTEYILKDGDTAFNEAYKDAIANRQKINRDSVEYWDSRTGIDARFVWTDDYYNLLSVIRFR